MARNLDPVTSEAVDVVNYALTYPDEFPEMSRIGQVTFGAIAAGADIEQATRIAVELHMSGGLDHNSLYLAGAVAVIGARNNG